MSDDDDEVEVEEEQEDGESRGSTPASVLLSVIRAAEAPIALIFRRGPTKQVRMIRWDMRRDDFVRGQWLAGRVYPERCDLSPNGKYVLYFAMRRGNTWNAISKLPYFTPLAVWEEGGTWGGGGAWISNTEVRLRANPAVMALDPKFTLPDWLTVGWYTAGQRRDVWEAAAPDHAPFSLRRGHATVPDLALQRREALPVMRWRNTDRHAYVFRLFDHRGEVEHELGTADWADWHPSGDIVIARDGLITRIPIERRAPGEPHVIADFTGDTFEKMRPPPDASTW